MDTINSCSEEPPSIVSIDTIDTIDSQLIDTINSYSQELPSIISIDTIDSQLIDIINSTLQEMWLVMPRKATVKIGDAENRCRWCRDKNQWKRAKIPVRLVLSRVPFKSGVWNWAYKMPKYVFSLLVKPKLKKSFTCFTLQIAPF